MAADQIGHRWRWRFGSDAVLGADVPLIAVTCTFGRGYPIGNGFISVV